MWFYFSLYLIIAYWYLIFNDNTFSLFLLTVEKACSMNEWKTKIQMLKLKILLTKLICSSSFFQNFAFFIEFTKHIIYQTIINGTLVYHILKQMIYEIYIFCFGAIHKLRRQARGRGSRPNVYAIVDLCFVFSWFKKVHRVVSSGIAASPS